MPEIPNYLLPLPDELHPQKFRCVTFYVPDDVQWYMSFWGWLSEMSFGKRWQRDSAHNGLIAAALWDKIIADARVNFLQRLCDPVPCPPIDEGEDEMSLCETLRFQDGKLQALCCGVWEDITGQPSQGIGGGGQPGDGSPQPAAGGGCQDYTGNMGGATPWYVPTSVSSGDTISIHDTSGLFYNAADTFWFCPDGNRFFITCQNQTFTDPSSQMPAVPMGRIVAKIGSTYYDVLGGVFTVPSGHTNDPVQLEMNTPLPAGSGGDVQFTITVCNNATAAWSSVLDLTTSAYPAILTIDNGTYIPGTGVQGVALGSASHEVDVHFSWSPPGHLTTAIAQYSAAGSAPVNNLTEAYKAAGFSVIYGVSATTQVATHYTQGFFEDAPGVTWFGLAINAGTSTSLPILEKITLQGVGPKPTGLP